jgi:nucleoside-diphosphate-sugar epimerase
VGAVARVSRGGETIDLTERSVGTKGRIDMQASDASVIGRVAGFYRSRKVLVTGGMSFIGSHLVEGLVSLGAEVTIADDLSSGREANIASVQGQVRTLVGDLRDPSIATLAARDQQIIFHLAAAHGGRGYIDTHPVECLNNMLIDHNVFTAAVQAGAEKVVFASSACVYPTVLQDRHDNRLLLQETDAGFERPGQAFADGEYGWAKLMGELQLRAFHRQHDLEGVACRIFTVYGERENESHAVIALIAKALARLDPYPIWGDGLQTRNFTYVGDTVTGLILAGALLSGFEVINIGTQEHVSINELIEEIFAIVGWRPLQVDRQLDKPVGVKSRAADVSKSWQTLGWAPGTSLSGLSRTVEWYAESVGQERLLDLEAVLMSR